MTDDKDKSENPADKGTTKNSNDSAEKPISKKNVVGSSTSKNAILTTKPADPKKESFATSAASNKPSSSGNSADLFNAKPIPRLAAKKSSRVWLLPAFVALLLIISLLVTGWTAYQQKLIRENWSQLQTKVGTQINQQSQAIIQIKAATDLSIQTINRAQLQLNQLSANNQNLNESLLSTQERLKSLSGRQKQDWMLAEAAYLIKVAQFQLSLQKDKTTAIQLLRSADKLILQMNDGSLTPIRDAIAKDISEISLIMEADQTGISLALNAISQQVPKLNIIALELAPVETSNPSNEMAEDSWFDLAKIYQQFLEDFVVIKDHSEPVKPLMTPDQRANLNSNIQLAIQQAQIALTTGNETLYRINIENAIAWIKDFFKLDENTQQIIKQLQGLKLKAVETHYPDQLKSKQALEETSRQQLYQWLDVSLSGNSILPSNQNDSAIENNEPSQPTSDKDEEQGEQESKTAGEKNDQQKQSGEEINANDAEKTHPSEPSK